MNDPADDMPLAVFAIAYEDTTAATIFDKSETAAIHVTPIWHPEMEPVWQRSQRGLSDKSANIRSIAPTLSVFISSMPYHNSINATADVLHDGITRRSRSLFFRYTLLAYPHERTAKTQSNGAWHGRHPSF